MLRVAFAILPKLLSLGNGPRATNPSPENTGSTDENTHLALLAQLLGASNLLASLVVAC